MPKVVGIRPPPQPPQEIPTVSEEASSNAVDGVVKVTTTATQIKAENSDRLEIIITNNSPTIDVFIGIDNALSFTSSGNAGIRLKANGSSIVFDKYQGDIYGICENGGEEAWISYIEVIQ